MNYRIGQHVECAMNLDQPIVALESTILTHGLPYPINLETASKCEEVIRQFGAVPCTIGIIDGVVVYGLTLEEIKLLVSKPSIKVSKRDIPYCQAMKLCGGTTVSATMYLAGLINIPVFATGGIGGVHRGVETTWDISSDLVELANSPVIVVSAGAKAILDLSKTLEVLETNGVLVLGYQTKVFPGFYTNDTPFKCDYKVELEEVASVYENQRDMHMKEGILFVNPIPHELSLPYDEVDELVRTVLKETSVVGKDTTPLLLGKIAKVTKGKSILINQGLVYNNCQIASELAVLLKRRAK